MQELYELAIEIDDPEDWNTQRLKVMECCIRDKFRRHRDLSKLLRRTGNRTLVNSYQTESTSNLYWGICKNKGFNYLGQILTRVRLDIHNDIEI